MSINDLWGLFSTRWFMSVTMLFGSFIAGASSEGGGAIAFPAMTLIFDLQPSLARNFSLAIQSVGMTSAALLILFNKIKVEYKFILLISIGGILGMILGALWIAPLIPSTYAKILFVTLWLSFGIILYYFNEIIKRQITSHLPKTNIPETISMILIGVVGGIISSILGSGIDVFSFSYITLRYHVSEKVATPTSVIIMAINSVIGFFVHFYIIQDFSDVAFNYWLVCIPIVIIGAPLGAFLINKKTRKFIAYLLYSIILVQFIGAFLIIKPSGYLLGFSIAVFLTGLLLFFFFNRLSKR